jgi:hypothetical protein
VTRSGRLPDTVRIVEPRGRTRPRPAGEERHDDRPRRQDREGRGRRHGTLDDIRTGPGGAGHEIGTTVPSGRVLDLTGTVVGLVLETDEFPRG